MTSLQVQIAFQGKLATFAQDTHLKIARGARIAAEKQQERAKIAYRGAIRQAGLGDRVANALRVDIFPRNASAHTHAPSVYVWSKAPKITYAFATGVTIQSHEGLWLAIPTDNVPHKGRKPATPVDVEVMFNQDLIFKPSRRRDVRLGFVDVIAAQNGRGFRAKTKGRLKRGRQSKLVLMFIFIKQVTLRKRIDWDLITNDLGKTWQETFAAEIAGALNS